MINTTTTPPAQGELRDTTLLGPWHYKPSDGVFRGEVLDESGDLITRNDATDEIGVLMAAAPELLAALRQFDLAYTGRELTVLAEASSGRGEISPAEAKRQLSLRAAIAKAEGRAAS